MAYRFKKNEAIPSAIQRVFAEEISWAVGQMLHAKNRSVAVHEARKSVKKIRGLLSLLRPHLGPLYKTEDRYFRNAGRLLSDDRDQAVILDVFDALTSRHTALDAAARSEIRYNLVHGKREADVGGEFVHCLQQARQKAQAWPLDSLHLSMLLPSVADGYRKGRKALKRAQKTDKAEALHELRKKVKQHWFQLRLLEMTGDAGMKERAADLHDLETWLGDEHNLNVLADRLLADAETRRDRARIRPFLAVIKQESNSIRKRALAEAEKVYAEHVYEPLPQMATAAVA